MSNPFRYFNSSPEVIRLVVMMYVRYPLSLRNVEDLLAERGIDISDETVRFSWNRFGPMFAAEIRKRRVTHMRGYPQWRWHLDEVFVKVNGKLCWHCHGAPGLRRSRWPGSRTRMKKISYSGYRFPPEIIQQAIWLYLRFTLSLRDVEGLLAERGVAVSYETVRRWVNHFGPMIAANSSTMIPLVKVGDSGEAAGSK